MYKLCYVLDKIYVLDDKDKVIREKEIKDYSIWWKEELSQEEEGILKGLDKVVSEIPKQGLDYCNNCCADFKKKVIEGDRERLYELSELLFKDYAKNYFSKDKILVLLINTSDGLNKIINEKVMRIKELIVYEYPLLYEESRDNEEFIKKVIGKDGRERLIEYDESIENIIYELATNTRNIIEIKKKMDKEIAKRVKEIMPNTSYLIGEKIAAKLLVEAGSLERLAKMPSSTIQVIGAEKSLFLHLKGRAKSPKHGIIYLTDYIQKAPRQQRGKVARLLALKINMAVKIDYFDKGKVFKGEELKKELLEQIKGLR